MAIDIASDVAEIVSATGDLPVVAGTLAQGSNTKAVTVTVRRASRTRPGPGETLDLDNARLLIKASEFASGWSGTNPVKPAPGMTFTVAGERVWTVGDVEQLALGHLYALDLGRRVQRGGS